MLYCDRIDISEGTDPIKINNSKECMICHYLFFNYGFKFQNSVYNGWHDLLMLSVNISGIAIITIKKVDYHCIIHNISKSEAINLLKNSVLESCGYIYKKYCLKCQSTQGSFFYFFCFAIYKMFDSEYSMNIYKFAKINVGTVMRNPKMLKVVPDNLKTKKNV